jgi:hypothetical protein
VPLGLEDELPCPSAVVCEELFMLTPLGMSDCNEHPVRLKDATTKIADNITVMHL